MGSDRTGWDGMCASVLSGGGDHFCKTRMVMGVRWRIRKFGCTLDFCNHQ